MPTPSSVARALLCPVPCGHMDDALLTFNAQKRVAFGSDREEMFYDPIAGKQRLPKGTHVLIFVSQTGDRDGAAKRHNVGRIAYDATYLGWERANNQGKHREPIFRPASAHETDTEVRGFWEVSNLRRLPHPLTLSALRTHMTNGKVIASPRRPMFVNDMVISP